MTSKRRQQLFSAIIGFKLVALIVIWFAHDEKAYIGDAPATAEEAPAETQGTTTAVESKPETTPPSEAKPATPRKSFLANLLDLPPLNTDTMKKEELGKYLELVDKKRHQVQERLDTLDQREQQLMQLEKVIDEKLRLLDEERKFFVQTIQKEKEVQDERLGKLITLYAKMEPKKAAPVLEKMDKDLVVALFKAIPQKQVTKILEMMSPDKSVELTEYYGRIRSAREYDLLKEMNASLRKEFDDCKGMP